MKLSIITINRNNATGLRKTMESVFSQTYRDFEYIVVDGASTDGSVDVIREMSTMLNDGNDGMMHFQWISEPDTGIYNAMNKGIEIVEGKRVVNSFNCLELREDKHGKADRTKQGGAENKEDGYVLMLNSGDFLVDEHVIEHIMPELDGTDIVQGNVIKIMDEKVIVDNGYGKSDITFIDVMKGHFLHQASFCKIHLFEQYGFFDESYKINGDTAFYAKCLGLGNASFRYIDINIAYFDTTGISADPENKYLKLRKEEDERYAQMFSKRMWNLYYKEEKKMLLYDKLRAHKWSWNLTMAISKIIDSINKI